MNASRLHCVKWTDLGRYAGQLRQGEETVLRIVLGDLCPRASILPTLSTFFAELMHTRLHLDYEAVRGPAERLRAGTADLAFHRADDADPGMERITIGKVSLIPVAAPGFLPFDESPDVMPEQLRGFPSASSATLRRRVSPKIIF